MPIVLLRVDERLIHGQVVVGWGMQLHPDRIIVVDDEVAASTWEQELYALGLPPALRAEFASIARAIEQFDSWRRAAARTIVLTRDVATMRQLGEHGELAGEEVNIGGIHYAPGRVAVLPYVHLNDAERDELRRLGEAGAQVSARDLPGARPVSLSRLLARARSA